MTEIRSGQAFQGFTESSDLSSGQLSKFPIGRNPCSSHQATASQGIIKIISR